MEFGRRTVRGVTLVELLVTIAILGIALSLALPAFDRLVAANSMAGSVNLFLSQLHLARSSAITREKPVALCPATSPVACSNNHRTWHGGYLLFQDNNRNREPDPGEPRIGFEGATAPAITIATSSKHRNRILFRPSGRAWFSNTVVRFCHHRYPSLNRAIVISNNGRTRVVKQLGRKPVRCT